MCENKENKSESKKEKTSEEYLREHLEKFSWLWEDNSPYPWENKKVQIKSQQEQQSHR